MIKKCIVCKEEINPLRLKALPSTNTCVNHSSTERKSGYTIQVGEGDHTYNDIIIIEPEQKQQFEQLLKQELKIAENIELDNTESEDEEDIKFDPNDLDYIDQPNE